MEIRDEMPHRCGSVSYTHLDVYKRQTLGKRPLDEGVRLMVAHIDSPRLDLKPNPLYEDSDIALFKTHYYGGIRKYQWGATPLSLHLSLIHI